MVPGGAASVFLYECPEAAELIAWALQECSEAGILCSTGHGFYKRLDIANTGVRNTCSPNPEIIRDMIESFSSLALLWKHDEAYQLEQQGRKRHMILKDPTEGMNAGDTDDEDG